MSTAEEVLSQVTKAVSAIHNVNQLAREAGAKAREAGTQPTPTAQGSAETGGSKT